MFSSDDVTANYDTLMNQAPSTILVYVREIRREMGEDWCDANPQAFATLVQAAAIDFHAATIGKELGKLTRAVSGLELGGGDT